MKNTTPAYTKWITLPFGDEKRFTRASAEPEPLPFKEIHEEGNHTVGPPSSSADSMQFSGSFEIRKGADDQILYGTCSLFLGVDDWGLLEVRNAQGNVVAKVDLQFDSQSAGDQGGCGYHSSTGGAQLPSGSYTWSVSQTNIDYDPPSGNVSVCNYKIDVVPTEPGGKEKTDPCDCEGDTCNGDGGGAPPSSNTLHSLRAGDAPAGYSSAGCSVTSEITESLMYWSCNFASFRGLGSMPAGRVELRAEDSVSGLQHPSALAFNHPLSSYLEVPVGGIVAGSRFDLIQGSRVIAMRCDSNGVDVRTVGVDTLRDGIAVLTKVSGQFCLRWTLLDGSSYLFSAATGELVSFTTRDKKTITNASTYLVIKRAQDGSLLQAWNLWDGLLNVESVTPTGYVIALYTPAQITGTDEAGLYTVEGVPFKTFSASLSEGGKTFAMTERTPGRMDYHVAWWKTGLAWNMQKGEGEEALLTTSARTELEPSVWQLVVEQSKNGIVSSRIGEIYQTTDVGDLLLTRVDGYGTDEAQTTQYEYDQGGRLKTSTAPDGSQSYWTYDNTGRQLSSDEPWAESGRRIAFYEYAHSSADEFNDDLKSETVKLRPHEGPMKDIAVTAYQYNVANHIKRTEKRMTGLGVTGPRLRVTEQWLSTAPNVHSGGRTRMTQQVNGVQTWYDYTASTEHEALYTETMETRVNGETVPGQSARTITWITAEGQRVREETFALLSNGQWTLSESSDYEFDTQNRWVKRTRGNGRVTQRALMCDGRSLWEIDEDGIRMDYAYDSARQQIEITRSAVMDGTTVISPEIITAWTRDANGRILTTTIYSGAMQTTESTAYDLLGRTVSSTDILGRTTTWAYSADGLTTMQTAPSGATLITRSAPDGTIMEESGTGQRHTITFSDLANDGIRIYTRAITGGTEVELQRSIVNGIGETLRTGVPNTSGGIIFTCHTYNAKGQLIKEQTDAETSATTMAPTLWVYDTFGNKTKETWQLVNNPNLSNSRITEWAYSMERSEDGNVYRVTVTTKNNGQGTTYTEQQKQLVSSLSATLERQIISTDPRGNDSIQWAEYGLNTERIQKTTVPTSTITAQTRILDNFAVSQTNHAGITTTNTRAYTSTGITYTSTDGRGNATITQTDLSGRTVTVTDAAGNTTQTAYHPYFDQPFVITDATGHTACCSYDIRGRKIAEWGTGIQPCLFTYDDANRMTSLTTFRVSEEEMTTDPSGRTDGDTTTWTYDESSGLTVRKTYADGTHEDTTYNALNLKASFTDARGVVSTYTWNMTKGVCYRIQFSDGTPTQDFVYNHLAMMIKVVDASGTRDISYNIYNEQETDGITLNTTKHTVTEAFDNFGRSTGYVLGKGSTALDTVAYAYGAEGRISGSSFFHGGETKSFAYAYLPGTNLLKSIVHPNGITTTRSYEAKRDLMTGIHTAKGAEQLAHYGYSYDAIGRPTNRTRSRGSETHNDSFTYNQRNELTGATLETTPYAYNYDNIGNRETAQEAAQAVTNYITNPLNQYASIEAEAQTPFTPQYDAAGNQTKVRTSTCIWSVVYDANNRPISFTSQDGNTIVTCGYDYMGRRYMKKVTANGTVTLHHHYLYRGYLQIAALDLTATGAPALWHTLWDPTDPVATRPLSLRKNGTWYTYGHDLTKNITELYNSDGTLQATYDYTPFGAVTTNGIEQPFQWSSEVYDAELGMVYYNYRHYNPMDGRWINRDPIGENGGLNLYAFVGNNGVLRFDRLGLARCCCGGQAMMNPASFCINNRITDGKNCSIIIGVGHCSSAEDFTKKYFEKADKMSFVCCYQQRENSTIDQGKGYPNPSRLDEPIFPGIIGKGKKEECSKNKVRLQLELEIKAARNEAKNLCVELNRFCKKVVIKTINMDKSGSGDNKSNWGGEKKEENFPCGKKSCKLRGGTEK